MAFKKSIFLKFMLIFFTNNMCDIPSNFLSKRVNILGDGPLAFVVVWTHSCKMNCTCKLCACRRPVGSLDSARQNKTTLSSNTGVWMTFECFIFLLLQQYLYKFKQSKICNEYPVLDLADMLGKLDGYKALFWISKCMHFGGVLLKKTIS